MSVNLSPVAGAAAQFLDNSGNVLTGGKLYTYLAGTTTPAATYTSSTGVTFHSNPIILDAAGRVPAGGEIWLSDNVSYKFVLKDANDVLIATWDNLVGINSNFVNYTSQEEIIVATAGQTVFNLTTVTYVPGTNSLQVFVDGVNQYDGITYAYVETNATTVTFTAGLHVGALVKFTTAVSVSAGSTTADLVIYDPPFTGGVATTVEDKLAQTVSVKDFGAVGDGITDDYAAFQDAINSVPVSGGVVFIPSTTTNLWKISQTLNVRKKVHIIGQVAYGSGTEKGTQLVFPADVTGFVFNAYNTSFYTTVAADPLFPGASGSILENVMLLGGLGSVLGNGVVLRTNMECRNVYVRNFKDHGFRIYADIGGGGDIEGDANGWVLNNCTALLNGGHGLYVDGADANVGVATKFKGQANGGYGIYDNSLIGNTYIGADTVSNTTGSVYCVRSSNYSAFVGTWEDGGGESTFGPFVTSVGGNGGNPSTATTGFHLQGGLAQRAPFKYQNNQGTVNIASALGKNDATMSALTFGTANESAQLDAWKLKADSTNNLWFLQYANSTSFQPWAVPNSASAIYTNKGFTGPIFQNGYAVKNSGTAYGSALVRRLGTAAPTTGTYQQGDIFYNSAPTSGGYIGWVCTVGGTPGTWKTFGLIS